MGDEMREVERDAARWRFLRDHWPDVTLGWLDVETGNFGGEHGDEPIYVRTPSVGWESGEQSWEGETPDDAVDAAMQWAAERSILAALAAPEVPNA